MTFGTFQNNFVVARLLSDECSHAALPSTVVRREGVGNNRDGTGGGEVRNRQEKTGTDINIQEQTGTDRNRQEQKGTKINR